MKFDLESAALRKFVSVPFYESRNTRRNSNWPTISIVVPSLNQGRFLEKTILSILNQNYPNCELIIIDGGSTDGTTEIIKKYEKNISYWVSERDKGQSDALNKGMLVAGGDFIGWQNADDIYAPGAFQDFIGVQRQFPGYDIYYGNRYYIDEDDRIFMAKYLSKPSLYYFKYRGMTLTNQTTFFSRNVVRKYGEIDVSLHYAMDNEFFLRAFLLGGRAKHIPRFWGAIRHHRCSKTGGGNAKEWELEHRYIRQKHHLPEGVSYLVRNKVAILVRIWGLIQQPKALVYHFRWHFAKNSAGEGRSLPDLR